MTETGEKHTVSLGSQSKYWATPDCNTSSYSDGMFGQNIREQTSNWASPRASDGEKGGPNQRGTKGDLMLPGMTAQWPTPAAQQYGGTAAQHLARKNKMQGSARKTVTELNAFLSVWPTPQAHDSVGGKTPEQIAAMRTKGHGVS